MHAAHVMLVDANRARRELLAERLRGAGAVVTDVDGPALAVPLAEAQPPDVVVMPPDAVADARASLTALFDAPVLWLSERGGGGPAASLLRGEPSSELHVPCTTSELVARIDLLAQIGRLRRECVRNAAGPSTADGEAPSSGELDRLLEAMPFAAVAIDCFTRSITRVNRAALALTGRTSEELIGRRCERLFPDTCSRACPMLDGEHAILQTEHTLLTGDGERIPVYKSVVEISRAGRPHLLELIIDARALKHAEAARQESEERLRLALGGADLGVWDWAIRENRLTVDERWAAQLGQRPEDIEPTVAGWRDRLHPDDAADTAAALRAHLGGRTAAYESEHRMRAADGGWRWMLARGKVVGRDDAGRPLRMTGTTLDITDRKLAEEALRRSEERFRSYFEQSLLGMAILSPDQRILKANARLAKMLDADPAALHDANWADFCHPDDLDAAAEAFDVLLLGEETGYTQKRRLLRSDGEELHALTNTSGVRGDDGAIDHLLVLVQDITERERAEQRQREQLHFLETLIEAIPSAVFFKDRKGRYELCNQTFADWLGLSPDEIIGKTVFDIAPPELAQTYHAADQEVFVRGGKQTYEAHMRHADGTTREILLHKAAYVDSRGELAGLVGVITDISERKATESQLREHMEAIEAANADLMQANRAAEDAWRKARVANAELVAAHIEAQEARHRAEQTAEQLAEAQEQIIAVSRQAGMAEVATSVLHNVGNVLNSANVSATLLTNRARTSKAGNLARAAEMIDQHAADLAGFLSSDERGRALPGYLVKLAAHLQEEQTQMLAELENLGKHLDHVKSVVAMQQTYAKVSGVTESLALPELLDDALRLAEVWTDSDDIELVREYGAVAPLLGDRQKLLQIIVNLARNARHALLSADLEERRLVVRLGAVGDDRVRIEVVDNGVGISGEHLKRLFTYGFTTKKEGHGFGLHNSALAAREMGGSLTAHSDGEGYGATFTLELPLRCVEDVE